VCGVTWHLLCCADSTITISTVTLSAVLVQTVDGWLLCLGAHLVDVVVVLLLL